MFSTMPGHLEAVIGDANNFWLYSSRTGFDLTRERNNSAGNGTTSIHMQTTNQPITITSSKTALVIIDMQNFFLSPAFGRKTNEAGHNALQQLKDLAIPAARRAGIRIIWVNWGLTQNEVDAMPPAIRRAFGFEAVSAGHPNAESVAVDRHGHAKRQDATIVVDNGKDATVYRGLGQDCGIVVDPANGENIQAGRLLMREQWNSALYSPLNQLCEEGMRLSSRPDVLIHKNRMSAMWGATTDLEQFLEAEGLKTLLFAGVNTDQCVSGTLTDAFSKGYDCVLLSDGAGTTSPEYAQQCVEFNCARSYGFVATCKQFADGVTAAFA